MLVSIVRQKKKPNKQIQQTSNINKIATMYNIHKNRQQERLILSLNTQTADTNNE